MKADVGLIGLSVMGRNLALNLDSKGYRVALYNREITGEASIVNQFTSGAGKGKSFIGTYSLEQFIERLARPRKIILMLKVGQAIDEMIAKLMPLLSPGDVIIDCADSYYKDTYRRVKLLESKWMYFIGLGVSGSEEGVLKGPSLMPGGSVLAWPMVKDMLQNVAAKLPDGTPCCQWLGSDGAGHFVKMVHNGIEYGDMQLIADAYAMLKYRKGLDNDGLAVVFEEWNMNELKSYLIGITAQIFAQKNKSDEYVIDKILDIAEQKGSGKWTVSASMEENDATPLIAEAVYARMISALHDQRIIMSEWFDEPVEKNKELFIEEIRLGLYVSKIISYAQGFSLLYHTSKHHCWDLDLSVVANIWLGGSLIESSMLERIAAAYQHNPDLENLLFDEYFRQIIKNALPEWRKTVSEGVLGGIPIPGMSSALAYFDGLRTLHSSANLIQAQRDYFGSHAYERVDYDKGRFFHTHWNEDEESEVDAAGIGEDPE